jgi:D-3-phosphoglycerate dehydrogenase / 2-oxoglutarate reductase
MTYKVVRVGAPLPEEQAAPERRKLSGIGAELVMHPYEGEDDLIAAARDADAIINAGGRFPKRVIDELRQCKLIVQGSVGYDPIDLDAATAKQIPVANLFDYCIEEVATHAMTLVLACARRLVFMERVVRDGSWGRDRRGMMGRIGPVSRLSETTLGIVGFGNIGKLVAERARGFGWRMLAADPYVKPEAAKEHGVELVPIEQLLRESDYVTLHVFLNDQTRHMINAERLALMKPSAYLINTCRGPIVDEPALIDALKAGKLAGAGLDVFEKEPIDMDNPLLQMDNVIVTPHVAVYSGKAIELNRTQPFDEVVRVLSGQWPRGLVNRGLREKLSLKDA